MNKENEFTLTEDQIKTERGDFQLNTSSSTLRSSYLNVNNEGSDGTDADGTDGADADGTDGTDGADTDGTDSADTDGTDTSDKGSLDEGM